jgi:hypothetical protein
MLEHSRLSNVNSKILLLTCVRIACTRPAMRGNKQKPETLYGYGQVEAAIAEVQSIQPENIGTLRARLRALRTIGVPQLPKTGSGKKLPYSRGMAFEMLLTLELDHAGFPPRIAALAAPKIRNYLSSDVDEAEKDFYVIVESPERGGRLMRAVGEEQLVKMIKDYAPNSFILLKLSTIVRQLDTALARIAAV